MPVRRRNAIRRRLEPARLALARLILPQEQHQQQQHEQPTPGPRTDARPFSFDGCETITISRRSSEEHRSETSAHGGDGIIDHDPAHRSSLFGGPDQTVVGSLALHSQHGWRRSPAVLFRGSRTSSSNLQEWRDLIPSNPFADEDQPAQPRPQSHGQPTPRALPSAPVAHAVRTSRHESVSSSVYSSSNTAEARARSWTRTGASDEVDSAGATAGAATSPSRIPLPLSRQSSWSSAISEASEASGRRSVSPVRDYDNPRRRRRYGWDGSQMPSLNFPE
ncbi:hypothetical protein V8F20_003928 [Naviculisporaceae sp. PSN 640]